MATKWGIIGAGRISEDFVRALKTLPDTEHKVVAVAARSLERATDFAKKLNIPKAYGNYEELAQDCNIDVVYIGTLHPWHAEHSKLMLEAGKPVLCEKPFCMTKQEASEVLKLAKDKQLFIMEAMWTKFFPVYRKLRDELLNGTIGDPRLVKVRFGVDNRETPRFTEPELGGGALLIMGCYCVQIVDLVFGDRPEKITATGTLLSSGADDTSILALVYPGGRMAEITCSVSCNFVCNGVLVYGTKGVIEIPKYLHCASDIIVNGATTTFPTPPSPHPTYTKGTQCMIYEAQHVRARLIHGDLESPIVTHESSLIEAEILEEARSQLGAK